MAERGAQQILVVEDDPKQAGLLARVLHVAGYEVRTAGSGKTALTCATEAQPDLVILDVGLPDMSGYEVCRRLRHYLHPWTTPILILSGRDKPSDQLRGFAHGADAYLTKPFDVPELLRTIALLFGELEGAGAGRW